MSSRRIFLTRLVQLGLHLSASEKGAVLHGSCEAADIHPFFIHAAHLLGYLIYLRTQGQNLTGGKLQVYLNNALYSLAEVESDSYTMVQACYILSFFHMSCENIEMANKYLCDAASVSKGIGLSFDSSVTGGPSDDARERIIVLMIQLVYLENYLYVVLNHPPRHFVELEAQMVAFNVRTAVSGMMWIFL
jgi:Fungal specific transcription factor domain